MKYTLLDVFLLSSVLFLDHCEKCLNKSIRSLKHSELIIPTAKIVNKDSPSEKSLEIFSGLILTDGFILPCIYCVRVITMIL